MFTERRFDELLMAESCNKFFSSLRANMTFYPMSGTVTVKHERQVNILNFKVRNLLFNKFLLKKFVKNMPQV